MLLKHLQISKITIFSKRVLGNVFSCVCLSTNGEYLCRALELPFFSEPRPQPLSIQSLPYSTLATPRHVQTCLTWISLEFFLNIFTVFAEFSDKNICHYSKRTQTCCVRDQDATIAPTRHT